MLEISIKEENYVIKGNIEDKLKSEIPSLVEISAGLHECPLLAFSSFSLASYSMKNKKNVKMSKDTAIVMKKLAQECTFPQAYLNHLDQGQLLFKVPSIPAYTKFMENLGARFRRLNIYSISQSRLYEFYRLQKAWTHSFLPNIALTEELKSYLHEDLTQSNDVQSLFSIEPEQLYSIEYGYQMNEKKIENAKKRLKWGSVGDLILTRPRRYEDRTAIMEYSTIPFGVQSMFKVEFIEHKPSFNHQLILFKVRELSSHKIINCQMYGGQYIKGRLKPGEILNLIGMKIRHSVMSVSQIVTDLEIRSLPIMPIYNASPSNGFTTKVITNCTQETLERFDGKDLFFYIKNEQNFWDAVKSLHFPKNLNDYSDSIDTLAYLEMVCLQLLFLEKKTDGKKLSGVTKRHIKDGFFDNAIKKLPFQLTKGQEDAIKQMTFKMKSEEPADVLLSGDVGSGKSLIATLLSLFTVDNKQQVVIAGPTEVLARQLYQSVIKVISSLDNKPEVEFISGAIKGSEAKEIKQRIKKGEIDIIVGTHTVFNLKYNNLGLVVIDEQQKFGAAQREKLREMGRSDGKKPDMLSQTATPIPRSTAQAFYGDIDLIQVLDKPAGRKEIITKWNKSDSESVLKEKVNETWSLINEEIEKGNQIFIICPAVEDKDETDFMTVEKAEKIIKKRDKDLAKAIHGKMSKQKQKQVIDEFKNKEFPILIGSSILEVGIDIPQATVMVVLDADRFGASSLHQIRGRVGRNDLQSYCILVSNSETDNAATRLNSLVKSNNGFDIALVDLKTRKQGDILGTRQSGESNLRFADFVDHGQMIETAQAEARRLYKSPLKAQALNDAKAFLKKEE